MFWPSEWNYCYFIRNVWIMILVTLQTGRKYFKCTRRSVVALSDTLKCSRNCLQTDLWTWIRTFAYPFEASYEYSEPTLQLEIIYLLCNDELRSKLREGDLLNFYKCLPQEKYLYLRRKAAVYASLFGSTVMKKISYCWSPINLHNGTGWQMKILRQSFDWPQQASRLTWNAWRPQCRLTGRISMLLCFKLNINILNSCIYKIFNFCSGVFKK
jgi:hypothetical protein